MLFLVGIVSSPNVAFSAAAGNSDGQDASEYEVKSAYLYNFAKFVEWPANAFADKKSPINIGIIGNDLFCSILNNSVQNKKVNERPLTVRCAGWNSELRNLQILFVSSSEMRRLPQISSKLMAAPVLLITESSAATEQGSIINFVWEGKRIRFEIEAANAEKVRLKISSKLLVVARAFRNEERR